MTSAPPPTDKASKHETLWRLFIDRCHVSSSSLPEEWAPIQAKLIRAVKTGQMGNHDALKERLVQWWLSSPPRGEHGEALSRALVAELGEQIWDASFQTPPDHFSNATEQVGTFLINRVMDQGQGQLLSDILGLPGAPQPTPGSPQEKWLFRRSVLLKPTIVRALVAAGWDPNARNGSGNPILFADMPEPSLRVLLEAGADPDQCDEYGISARQYRKVQAALSSLVDLPADYTNQATGPLDKKAIEAEQLRIRVRCLRLDKWKANWPRGARPMGLVAQVFARFSMTRGYENLEALFHETRQLVLKKKVALSDVECEAITHLLHRADRPYLEGGLLCGSGKNIWAGTQIKAMRKIVHTHHTACSSPRSFVDVLPDLLAMAGPNPSGFAEDFDPGILASLYRDNRPCDRIDGIISAIGRMMDQALIDKASSFMSFDAGAVAWPSLCWSSPSGVDGDDHCVSNDPAKHNPRVQPMNSLTEERLAICALVSTFGRFESGIIGHLQRRIEATVKCLNNPFSVVEREQLWDEASAYSANKQPELTAWLNEVRLNQKLQPQQQPTPAALTPAARPRKRF